MIGILGGPINHSLAQSLNPAPFSACSAFSAVKASVRPPALLRNPQGEETGGIACATHVLAERGEEEDEEESGKDHEYPFFETEDPLRQGE